MFCTLEDYFGYYFTEYMFYNKINFFLSEILRNEGTLVVHCTTGGIWKFPMLFIATEPEVDDVINIEAIGLNKESIVDFKLTSQTR